MRSRLLLWLTAGLLVSMVIFPAVVTPARAQETPKLPAPSGLSSTGTSQDSDAALRSELELVRQYDERMQNTVYWALGVVVVVTVLLAGFSWYTNFRVYERDLEALKLQLQLVLQREVLNATDKLTELMSTKTEALSSKLESVVSQQDKALAATRKETKELASQLDEPIKRSLASLEINLTELDIHVREAEKASASILVTKYIKLFGLAIDTGWSFKFMPALQAIEKLMKAGGKLTSSEVVPKGEAVKALIPDSMAGI